jgi:serine/threonine protein phosphatase 1
MSTIVIGDVHGCYHTLLQLIEQFPKDSELIFVGDLCDRGLYTKDVIDFVIKNKYTCILGNHEFYMLENAFNNQPNRWIDAEYMGGKETLKSYENDTIALKKHLQWIKNLPQYIIKDRYFITHAFCLPYFQRRDDGSKSHAMMVNRVGDEIEWGYDWEDGWRDYDVINVFGHDHKDEIQKAKNYICIDTGCVYGGKLSAVELGSMKIYSQDLLQKDVSI